MSSNDDSGRPGAVDERDGGRRAGDEEPEASDADVESRRADEDLQPAADEEGPQPADADESSRPADADEEPHPADAAELAAEVELLREENRRLRGEYARLRQARYRRTAIGLAAVGAVAVGGGLLFPAAREVLFALGATGLFAAVLTRTLAPERFVAADVGERVYAPLAENAAAVAAELGLRTERVYLPEASGRRAKLFVPQRATWERPDEAATGPFVLEGDARGLLLESTGSSLFREFERTLGGEPAATPAALASQLADGLVEGFELAARADPDVDPADGRVTVAIDEPAVGDLDRFDHPIPAFIAAGLAVGLDRPVELEVARGGDADWLVTCRFDVDE